MSLVHITKFVKKVIQQVFLFAHWMVHGLAIAMVSISPALAATYSNQMTNTASVSVADSYSDPNTSNNSATAILDKQSRVSIRKIALGGDGEFDFKSSFSSLNLQIATNEALGQSDFKAVDIGTHQLYEAPKAG